MTDIFNRVSEKEKRRDLRNNLTRAEKIVWDRIRNKQVCGKRFRRQVSIGAYIVDFYCSELKLVIEIDGESHFTKDAREYDNYRNSYMQSLGLEIVRYTNNDIYNKINSIISDIKNKCS